MDDGSSSGDEWQVISNPSSPSPKNKEVQVENTANTTTTTTTTTTTIPSGTSTSPITPITPIMPGWKDEYLSSLLEAEKNSPVNQNLVEACTQLSDRIASLEAEKAHWQSLSSNTTPSQPPPSSSAKATSEPSSDPAAARLRADLAEALRQTSSLDARLRKTTAERDTLLAAHRSQSRAVRELTSERDALRLRVRDQAEELRGKKQMLEQVQDEVLALDLQLNVAEQQKAKIAAENKQLIERWMRRVRQEADDMNAANERSDGP